MGTLHLESLHIPEEREQGSQSRLTAWRQSVSSPGDSSSAMPATQGCVSQKQMPIVLGHSLLCCQGTLSK